MRLGSNLFCIDEQKKHNGIIFKDVVSLTVQVVGIARR